MSVKNPIVRTAGTVRDGSEPSNRPNHKGGWFAGRFAGRFAARPCRPASAGGDWAPDGATSFGSIAPVRALKVRAA